MTLALDIRKADPNNPKEIRRLQLRASRLAQLVNGSISEVKGETIAKAGG